MKSTIAIGLAALGLAACAGVREQDTAAWPGQPVAALEQHPIFVTMPVVKTQTSDGTEIWNYVNGRTIGGCTGSGVLTGVGGFVTGTAFQSCMAQQAACNNLFYIKDGVVLRYAPVGSGGIRCYTHDFARPGAAATNYR
jgi:hypothetical protein